MTRNWMPWYLYVCELGFLGKLPLAPGTWGSLGAVLLYWGLFRLGFSGIILGGLTLLITVTAVPVCNWGSLYMAQQDPPNVVLDELVGQWIALFPVFWIGSWEPQLPWAFVLAFLLFRFFDVLNVYPINVLERLEGGWGIVLDDCLAGVYANLCLVMTAQYLIP